MDRNIKDMLVHSKFSSKDVSGMPLPCGRNCCLTCPFVFHEVHTVEGPRGKFTPKEGHFEAVDRFISKCHDDFSQSNFKPQQRSNLKADEEKALQKLRNREDIVIKPTNKGGAVVVWIKDLYCDEAKKELSREQFYTNPVCDITNKISKTLEKELNHF